MKNFKKKLAYVLLGSMILGGIQSSFVHALDRPDQDLEKRMKNIEKIAGIFGEGEEFVNSAFENISVVKIPDENLRKALLKELKKSEDDDITVADLKNLQTLEATDVKDLSGLQYCTGLFDLTITDGDITDLSPISGLTNLNSLTLDNNKITDILQLGGLYNLKVLSLDGNEIVDISGIDGLDKLEMLILDNNKVEDITPIVVLDSLIYLHLRNNKITDIEQLTKLKNLRHLYLADNLIENIESLIDTEINDIELQGNKFNLDDEKIKDLIKKFKDKGYKVILKEEELNKF